MGGIKVDPETCETNVPGLFAAGECAGGLHGANRLGGNSLTDLLVFGRRAGEGAAEYVKSNGYSTEIEDAQLDTEKRRVMEPLYRRDGENPYELQQQVQEAMMEHANLMRNEESLQEGLEKILAIKERVPNVVAHGSTLFNPGWHAAQDVRYLTQISEIILRTALERTERRGAQWRLDYDGPSDELGKINFIVTKGEQGEIDIERREISPMPEHLSRVFDEEGDAQVPDEHGGEEEGKESQF
jgi:succinate dehydrogenase / fumarate reductase flavoprotein subunit